VAGRRNSFIFSAKQQQQKGSKDDNAKMSKIQNRDCRRDGIPFQENGMRYKIEPAAAERSTCEGCKHKIKAGSTRVGTSSQASLYGGWVYRHLFCTDYETVRDIRKTYQIDGLIETINHDVDDYSVVPRYNLLTKSEKEIVASRFESILLDGKARASTRRLTAKERRMKEVQLKTARTNRRKIPIEQQNWRAQLNAGELDGESGRYFKKVLRSLGVSQQGSAYDCLRRLKEYVKKEEEQGEEKDNNSKKKRKNSKGNSDCVISMKKRRKLLPELDLEAEV